MKYLYAKSRRGSEIYKVKVTRETEHNVWYGSKNGQETRIDKRTMCEGTSWTAKYWKADNDHLEKLYQQQYRKRTFERKLHDLSKFHDDETVYDAVMGIGIPEQSNL